MFDYLSPSSISTSEFEDMASLLNGNTGRPIKSAATEIENKYRIIKSQAEIKVMKKAADISSAAHAAVCTSDLS
jgi:intermediate cleaving peptidase 55